RGRWLVCEWRKATPAAHRGCRSRHAGIDDGAIVCRASRRDRMPEDLEPRLPIAGHAVAYPDNRGVPRNRETIDAIRRARICQESLRGIFRASVEFLDEANVGTLAQTEKRGDASRSHPWEIPIFPIQMVVLQPRLNHGALN